MNGDNLERLSALIDGELPEKETSQLIDETYRDNNIRLIIARYYLVGDGIRCSIPERLSADFAVKVSEAIAAEPSTVTPIWRAHPITAFAVGVVLAASVIVVAVVGIPVKVGEQPKQAEIPGQIEADHELPLSQAKPPIGALGFQGDGITLTARRFNSYLINHNQYRPNTGVHGVAPYARLIAYGGSD